MAAPEYSDARRADLAQQKEDERGGYLVVSYSIIGTLVGIENFFRVVCVRAILLGRQIVDFQNFEF